MRGSANGISHGLVFSGCVGTDAGLGWAFGVSAFGVGACGFVLAGVPDAGGTKGLSGRRGDDFLDAGPAGLFSPMGA